MILAAAIGPMRISRPSRPRAVAGWLPSTRIFIVTQGLRFCISSFEREGARAEKARALLAAGGVLSVQVLNEFAAVARRKLGKAWDEIGEAIEDALALVDPPLPLTMTLHAAARGRLRVIIDTASMMRSSWRPPSKPGTTRLSMKICRTAAHLVR